MNRVVVLMLAASSLSGCGIAAKVNARNSMQESLAAYKACLVQNPQNVNACQGAKLAYDADMRAYRATSAGIQPGRHDTLTINSDD
jgi:hypothetical protein